MNFLVTKQTIERTDSAPVIADSINYLTANFRFSSDWDTLTKHVTFTLGSNIYDKTLDEDDAITADQELNLTVGTWTIGIVGMAVEDGVTVQRITADTVEVPVSVAGALGGEAFPEISGAYGEAILQSEADRVVAEAARVSAESARASAEDGRESAEAEREEWYATAQSGNLHTHTNKTALDAVAGVNTGDQNIADFITIDDVHTHTNKSDLDLVSGTNTGDQSLEGFALTADLHEHTNKSDLDLVSGTNTGDQNLSDFITIDDVHTHTNKSDLDLVSGTNTGDQSLEGYALTADLHAHSNKSDLDLVSGTNTGDQNLSGFLTEEADPMFLAAASASAHYTGFPNRTATAVSFADASATFTLTATSDPVWINGVSYTINTLTKALTTGQQAVSSIYWFWITAPLGVPQLNCAVGAPGFDKCIVATVYWNAATASGVVSDERHWMGRDQFQHAAVHSSVGARFASGMSGTFTNNTISIGAGTFYDEDIEHSWVDPQTTVRVLYHNGSDAWAWDVLTTPYKVVNPGTDSNLRFNNGTALATVQSNRYANYWVYASGDSEYPINVFLGTADYTSTTNARAATPPSFGALLSAENKLLYRLTYKNNGGTPEYNSATDYRTSTSLAGTAYVATDHGSLTGLGDLDHPASAIRYTPTGTMTATTVQAAIEELYALLNP